MPTLFNCKKCDTKSWNLIPYVEISYMQSPHLLRDGLCPICGNEVAIDFKCDPRRMPQWESTLYGTGLSNTFATASGDKGKRPDHYFFAHDILRMYIHGGTHESFLSLFSNGDVVEGLLNRAYFLCKSEMEMQNYSITFDLNTISVDLFTIVKKSPINDKQNHSHLPFILFTLDQPMFSPEAYYIGVCLSKPIDEIPDRKDLKKHIVYCTLEVCVSEVSKSRTVLGRWYYSKDEKKYKHITYVGGPPPQDPYQFVEYVERLVCILDY